jgi:hypothetical protein
MSTIDESVEKNATPAPIEPVREARMRRQLRLDEHGHAIPLTEAEKEADTKALLIALAEMAAVPDDPPGSDEEFWRAIDAGRPDRPLFQEYYKP